jgi:hypothetical protein
MDGGAIAIHGCYHAWCSTACMFKSLQAQLEQVSNLVQFRCPCGNAILSENLVYYLGRDIGDYLFNQLGQSAMWRTQIIYQSQVIALPTQSQALSPTNARENRPVFDCEL